MKCIKHKDGVYEIQNVFTPDESSFLKMLCEGILESDWINKNSKNNFVKMDLKIFTNITRNLYPLFSSHEFIDPSLGIYRQTQDSLDTDYVDAELYDDDRVWYTAYWFINDDYSGGEIVYPDGTIIKPKAGSMLIHPGKETYTVKQIIGDRPKYFLCSLIKGDPSWVYVKLNQEKLDTMSEVLL